MFYKYFFVSKWFKPLSFWSPGPPIRACPVLAWGLKRFLNLLLLICVPPNFLWQFMASTLVLWTVYEHWRLRKNASIHPHSGPPTHVSLRFIKK